MILDKIKAYGWMAAALVLATLFGLQSVRLHNEQVAHERLKTTVAQKETVRTVVALQDEQNTSKNEATHAANTIRNADEFTTSQPVRDAITRADLAVVNRLRSNAEARATRYKQEAETNAATCRELANKLEAFDRHIVQGTEVVAGLRETLIQRDAEVVWLAKQIQIERNLNQEETNSTQPIND